MYIIVLGASGFLGNATSRALADAGHKVVGISRRFPPMRDSRIRYIRSNYDSNDEISEHYQRADVILHMAWDTTPSSSMTKATLEVHANLLPLARLLDSIQKLFSGRFIFVSTGGALYGEISQSVSNQIAALETTALNPISYYGAGKGSAELMLKAFSNETDTRLTLLRPSNVYGPGQAVRKQFAVVPTLLESLRDDRPFYVRGDGSATRDYLFIYDFVAFICDYLHYVPEDRQYSVFNVCYGSSITLRELISTAERVTGRTADIRYQSSLQTDLRWVELSASQAQTTLDWSARVSIQDGIGRTWRSMQT